MTDMRTSIENVLYDYVHVYDFGPMADVGKCFLRDGRITLNDGVTVSGREAISKEFVARRARAVFPEGSTIIHQVTNVHITQVSPTEAKVRSVFAFHLVDNQGVIKALTMGDYHDDFAQDEDGEWRIKYRRHRTYGRPAPAPQPG